MTLTTWVLQTLDDNPKTVPAAALILAFLLFGLLALWLGAKAFGAVADARDKWGRN